MGINGFEGVGSEWLLFQKKDGPCLRFLKEIGFEGGESVLRAILWKPSRQKGPIMRATRN